MSLRPNDASLPRTTMQSSVGRCVPYGLVCPLKPRSVWHWYGMRVSVGVHSLDSDSPLLSTLLSRVTHRRAMGITIPLTWGYHGDLTSNSLYLGAGLPGFLMRWRKVAGCSQVLVGSVMSQDGIVHSSVRDSVRIVFQFSKSLARVILVRSH